MHIAIVTETYQPEINGVAMTIGRMVAALRQRGHRVSVVRPRQKSDLNNTQSSDSDELLVTPIRIPMYPQLQLGVCWPGELRQRWSATKPDVVHIVTEGPLGLIACRVANKMHFPVTSGFHTNFHAYAGHYGFGWMSRLVDRYLRFIHNRTLATFVPTDALASSLSARGYRNAVVVSRGINNTQFNPSYRDASLREEWGATGNTLVCLYVGRLAAEKNISVVADAFQTLNRSVPDSRLVLVGEGPEQARISKQIPNAVFAGFKRGEDLYRHYASADLFLFASLTETFGNVTLEAMASGLAVVAFEDAAAKEVIEHGENGFIAPAGDNAAFIALAEQVANDADSRVQVIPRAISTAAGRTWERIHERVESIFATVAAGAPLLSLITADAATVDAHGASSRTQDQVQWRIPAANKG